MNIGRFVATKIAGPTAIPFHFNLAVSCNDGASLLAIFAVHTPANPPCRAHCFCLDCHLSLLRSRTNAWEHSKLHTGHIRSSTENSRPQKERIFTVCSENQTRPVHF